MKTQRSKTTTWFTILAVVLAISAGCSSDDATVSAESGATTSEPPPSSTEQAVSTTMPLPPDLETPPTAYFDPPLDLSGLVGRTASEGVAWGERQGFQEVFVMKPDGDIDANEWSERLVLVVDDNEIVLSAKQG